MQHFYKTIPGWCTQFETLYRTVVAWLPQEGGRVVEVGSFLGRSAALLGVEVVNSGKQVEVSLVDPWVIPPNNHDSIEGELAKWMITTDQEFFEACLTNLHPLADVLPLNMMRMPSLDAAPKFADGSLDFVFIDGNHDQEYVAADVRAWRPKLKPGGILAGDEASVGWVRKGLVDGGLGEADQIVFPYGWDSWIALPVSEEFMKLGERIWKTPGGKP